MKQVMLVLLQLCWYECRPGASASWLGTGLDRVFVTTTRAAATAWAARGKAKVSRTAARATAPKERSDLGSLFMMNPISC